jgi:hypothetical protein
MEGTNGWWQNVSRTTKGKSFWCSQPACWPVYGADIFSLCLHAGDQRLTPFSLQLNQAVFTPYLSLTAEQLTSQPRPSASDMWCQTCAEPRWAAMVTMQLVVQSSWAFELPFRKQTFSLRRGDNTVLRGQLSLCSSSSDKQPISFSSKACSPYLWI